MAGIAYLSSKGWIDIARQAMHVLNKTAFQFAANPTAISASGMQIAAFLGFVPGVMFGFKKG